LIIQDGVVCFLHCQVEEIRLFRVQLENPFREVSHFLIAQWLVSMLTELPPAMQAEEGVRQPLMDREGFGVVDQLGMLLPKLLFQRLERLDPLVPVVDQETAELFTTLATSRFDAAR
jgi:hypothetical protein